MSAEQASLAFVSLLRDQVEARGLSALLESVARPGARALFLLPEIRGRDFFVGGEQHEVVERWLRAHVPTTASSVFLLSHEDGLSQWLRGLDGTFVVAADGEHAHEYRGCTVVEATPATAALALAEAVILRYSGISGSAPPLAVVFDRRDAAMVANVRAGAPRVRTRPVLPSLIDAGNPVAYVPDRPAAVTHPLDLLVAESARAEVAAPAWNEPVRPARRQARRVGSRGRPGLSRLTGRAPSRAPSDAEMAARLLARAPTLIVIGSRKGGVGKTSHAAGIAIVAGEVLDAVGHRAAIVDANIANPDAWGYLDLPPEAATVRDVVSALTAGREPPGPAHAVTRALACYPEARHGVEYSRTDIRRLARYLRERHALTVVDMSNRLPDPTSGPEAAVAAFWLDEADALVLPTATSRQDFNGVLDYLDVPGLPPTLVPCIRSSSRRTREHPATRHYLATIAARVDRVVEIPDDPDGIRLAGMAGVPVRDVSPRLGAAYRELTDAVARLPRRPRHGGS